MRNMPPGAWTDTAESVPLLTMRGVTKSFARGLARASRRTLAVSNVDFDVFPGDVILVTGDEGAGKTTLLQCACNILRPDEGVVSQAAAAYVPTVPVYYPFLTPRDVLSLRGASPPTVDTLLAAFDILGFANGAVAKLLPAALKRLAIAESLVGGPSVLLIDTRTFDVPSCSAISAILAAGVAAVVAARNGSSMARMATRIVCLEEGRVSRMFSTGHSRVAERIH
jgi:ABC-type multidrug transport system ATPase subunit